MTHPISRLAPRLAAALALVALLVPQAARAARAALDEADYAAVNKAFAARVAMPAYDALATSATALKDAVAAACGTPGDTTLDAARAAFHAAMDDWQRAQHIRLGPAMADDRFARLQFWPDKRGITGRHLARLLSSGGAATGDPAVLARASVAVQGFPALERLLFAPAGKWPGKGCPAGATIAANVAGLAAELRDAWRPGGTYRKAFLAPRQTGTPYRTQKEVTGAVLRDLATAFRFLIDAKLGAPLALKTGHPKPRRCESWRSGRSLRNLVLNLESLGAEVAVVGAAIPEKRHDRETEKLIADQFRAAARDARRLGDALKPLIEDKARHLPVIVLGNSVRDLRELVLEHLIGSLDVNLGFNALDGD